MNLEAWRHYLRGVMLQRRKRPLQAMDELHAALAHDPGFGRAAHGLAYLLAADGRDAGEAGAGLRIRGASRSVGLSSGARHRTGSAGFHAPEENRVCNGGTVDSSICDRTHRDLRVSGLIAWQANGHTGGIPTEEKILIR